MKRTALKRRTPLRRKGPIAKRRASKRKPLAIRVRPLNTTERRAIIARDSHTCVRCDLDGVAYLAAVEKHRADTPDQLWLGVLSEGRIVFIREALRDAGETGTALAEPNIRAAVRNRRPPLDVDHVVPRAEGGTNEPGNLETLCCACHGEKTPADAGRLARLPTHRKTA